MDPENYARVAHRAGERYQAALLAFVALYDTYVCRPYSPSVASELRSRAEDVALSYLSGEAVQTAAAFRDASKRALRSAASDLNHPDGETTATIPEAFLGQSESFLLGELTAQTQRDIIALEMEVRNAAIRAQLQGAALATPAFGIDAFKFRDRLGRASNSRLAVSRLWRHSLMSLAAESYMLGALQMGASTATVINPGHPHDGLVLRVKPTVAGASFADLRGKVFHPNSNAILKAQV